MCNLQETLIPQPLLPKREKGSKVTSKSLSPLGEGFRVRVFGKVAHRVNSLYSLFLNLSITPFYPLLN
jgi:hypothetical protein